MTKSLWRDPIFDDMDPISQRILPYLPSPALENAHAAVDTTLSSREIKEFLKGPSYTDYDLTELIRKRSNALRVDGVNVEILNPPEEIVIDLVNDTISVGDLQVDISMVCNKETINTTIGDLFRSHLCDDEHISAEYQNKRRRHLKNIHAIFTNEKISARRLILVKYEVLREATKWAMTLDIRNADFPKRLQQELLSAMGGNVNSVLWLKVLKARSLSNETIYSMELT